MSSYYKPCAELDECRRLINEYYLKGDYKACFDGHLVLAKKGYALAEYQVGYFYMEGLGVEKNIDQAFYWTERGAKHGDRDAMYNLAEFYFKGDYVTKDERKGLKWLKAAARDNHDLAINKCREMNVNYEL